MILTLTILVLLLLAIPASVMALWLFMVFGPGLDRDLDRALNSLTDDDMR